MSLSCSEFFIAFFHSSCLSSKCFNNTCKQTIHKTKVNHSKVNTLRVLSCLPLFGQLLGVVFIVQGIETLKEEHPMCKIVGVTEILRGLFTFLGLGIVFLLIDVIITATIFIKHKIFS